MFGPLKGALEGRRFADGEGSGAWLASHSAKRVPPPDGIRNLVDHQTMCVEMQGNYVEK
jgi:hypothetical protein